MLAGEPPFTGPSPQAVIAKRFTVTPTPLGSHRTDVASSISDAIARAMSREPGDRFATAGDLSRALEAPALPRSRKPAWRRVAITVVIAMILVLGAWVIRRKGLPAPVAPRTTLAVLPFTVRGNPTLAYMREGMVELLSTKLDGAGELRAVDPRAVLSALRGQTAEMGPGEGSATARRFGAGRFILGSVLQVGDTLRLDATLYDAAGVRQAAAEAAVSEAELGRGVDDLARLLLARLSSAPAERLASMGALTTRPTPLCVPISKVSGNRAARPPSSAIHSAFQQAVTLDSTFALAWYRLATAAAWTFRDELWHKASDQAARHADRLSARDRGCARGAPNLAGGAAGRRGAAIPCDRREAHPDDEEAWFWLGDVRYHSGFLRGRPLAEAETALVRAVELDSADWQGARPPQMAEEQAGAAGRGSAAGFAEDSARSVTHSSGGTRPGRPSFRSRCSGAVNPRCHSGCISMRCRCSRTGLRRPVCALPARSQIPAARPNGGLWRSVARHPPSSKAAAAGCCGRLQARRVRAAGALKDSIARCSHYRHRFRFPILRCTSSRLACVSGPLIGSPTGREVRPSCPAR